MVQCNIATPHTVNSTIPVLVLELTILFNMSLLFFASSRSSRSCWTPGGCGGGGGGGCGGGGGGGGGGGSPSVLRNSFGTLFRLIHRLVFEFYFPVLGGGRGGSGGGGGVGATPCEAA